MVRLKLGKELKIQNQIASFNSNMVRLKYNLCDNFSNIEEVSIPIWYGLNTTKNLALDKISAFQFQYGTA